MAWSYSYRMRDFVYAPREPGVYEIGFIRNDLFNAQYCGKADVSIYNRLKNHYLGKGNKGVQEYLLVRERDNLWFHWMQVSDPCYTEASLLNTFGIGKGGLYKYNNRYELTPLKSRYDL